jgi:putative transposase
LRAAPLPTICLTGADATGLFSLSAPTGAKVKKSNVKRPKKPFVPNTKRTASILIEADAAAFSALVDVQAAYAKACNLLVPLVVKSRCWNKVDLHNAAYDWLRPKTPLGSQMVCNTFRTVCGAYKSMRSNGEIEDGEPVPVANFRNASVHYDVRTFTMRGDKLSLWAIDGRVEVTLRPGKHQKRLLAWGKPKEAELVSRKGRMYFNLVLEKEITFKETGPVVGLDVGENNLAATDTGKIWGGGALRHKRNRYLSQRRRLQSNGSGSARQLLRKVSGRESRRVRHENHVVSKAVVAEARRVGARCISMEDLTRIRDNIRAGLRVRSRLHGWAFRQLQDFVAYKAAAVGIACLFGDPAYSSQDCNRCGERGKRKKHRFRCPNGHQFHSDVNAARNHALRGEQMLAEGAEPANNGRPQPIRVARRDSRPAARRCSPPQCSGLADVVQHVSL